MVEHFTKGLANVLETNPPQGELQARGGEQLRNIIPGTALILGKKQGKAQSNRVDSHDGSQAHCRTTRSSQRAPLSPQKTCREGVARVALPAQA